MKKLLILILFFPLFSCNDWLNVESEVSVTYRNYFQSEQDVEDIFITMLGYERLLLANSFLSAPDVVSLKCTDISIGNNGIWSFDQRAHLANPKDWMNYYGTIYLANMLEDNRHRFKNISEERADYWIAQANFVKGLMYFEIARQWGDAPVAPRTEDATAKAKSPVDTILAYAIRAAETALILPTHDQLTDAQGTLVQSRQYASSGSVHTLLANIYVWMGGLYKDDKYWKKAEEEASLVIDGKVGTYDLVSMEDLIGKTFGKARDVTEVIFAIEINSQDEDTYNIAWFEKRYPGFELINYPHIATNTNPWDIEDGSFTGTRISVEDVKALYPEEKDLRRKEYWLKLGENPFPENAVNVDKERIPVYAYLNKWREPINSVNPEFTDKGSLTIGMEGNRVYWRLADLILLRAECRTHLGMMPEAVNDLDRIRNRAGLEGYKGSREKEILLREIFNERDRELFGETCRYYDIVRNGYIREELHGNYLTLKEEDIKNGALYLPVSESAFTKNPLMKQNKYWATWITK
ncbi:RagB/SusD family nutrient uptake outer membrane protein [Butyricimonas sp.]|uniref:RagB/SusD family nutrient uptake outer membrane protein n=1 Tax=Butyricimonas sp. TaxID=1969738 RepID=UPI0025C5E836|nr:RagB/SusD family nutrient uptake outer membrane protein [Butyricimonas sp.]